MSWRRLRHLRRLADTDVLTLMHGGALRALTFLERCIAAGDDPSLTITMMKMEHEKHLTPDQQETVLRGIPTPEEMAR